ncbi:MAG: tRNA preQ1(34) S-adenosylmethionine ribosyltransferase-isomerase QueA [Lachnospiraceae bacterium]|nr:tRNA preQ1(34) S-adenosylmethionine ribosyltransferase-isomerase QueA [Lachnospiraceae bacterium]
MELKISDFYYELPERLIAQSPLKERSSSRLMVLDRDTGETTDRHFYDIIEYLDKGDCLVINDTKVIPARLMGTRVINTSEPLPAGFSHGAEGAVIELLLLKRLSDNEWECLAKPGKKARPGTEIEFGNGDLRAVVKEVKEDGNRIVKFVFDGIFEEILDSLGQMPLPPYITQKLEDRDRYQTVYAKHSGSAAAPTAGLHFTNELLEEIEKKGVTIARVTLHVGLGTFRPVKETNILDHHMHSEYYEISEEAAEKINRTKKAGGRIVCVGTTSCRTIESAADETGFVKPGSGDTEIFIYPGYRFKVLDELITNFHLPESTLIMLVSALAGRENVMKAYKEAVSKEYRFFSFGDAMFIKQRK